MGNIGDKFAALPVAIGQLIPLIGNFARQLDKGIAQNRHLIRRMAFQRLLRQLLNGADTVLVQPADVRGQLFHRARHPIPDGHPGQQAKQRHQQQRPRERAPQRITPCGIGESIEILTLQNNVQIAVQFAVQTHRCDAEYFLLINAARIIAVDRPGGACEKCL